MNNLKYQLEGDFWVNLEKPLWDIDDEVIQSDTRTHVLAAVLEEIQDSINDSLWTCLIKRNEAHE